MKFKKVIAALLPDDRSFHVGVWRQQVRLILVLAPLNNDPAQTPLLSGWISLSIDRGRSLPEYIHLQIVVLE